jgi:hypothetical protein
MQESYSDAITVASAVLSRAIVSGDDWLPDGLREVDGLIRELLRAIGRLVFATVADTSVQQVVEDTKTHGLTPFRRSTVRFSCLFGPIDVESPYLYDHRSRRSSRPVQDVLGIRHGGCSPTLERALSDFGAEDSFGHATDRFEEHYGWSVDRGRVRRVTQEAAADAEAWVDCRLGSEEVAYTESLASRPGADEVVTEQDGSMARTGTLTAVEGEEMTPTRGLPRRRRPSEWREVRVGLARRLDETARTYVAAMDSYAVVTRSVFQAAVSCGLSARSETICVGDGANGLMEEMLSQFPNAIYILDRYHLLEHMHETAEEIGLEEREDRAAWVKRHMERIDRGEVRSLSAQLRAYRGPGRARVTRLAGYLWRFRDCVHYDAYREHGFSIGSGEVESAHRQIPQRRLKLPGACWNPNSINPMLALRVVKANNWWGEFWEQRKAA